MKTTVYTDGACSGNPGPGGWGIIIKTESGNTELSGGEALTTNNRMELMAVIKALEFLQEKSEVTIMTDSQYVKNGITTWIIGWKKNGWRTADKKSVKNQDLWTALDELTTSRRIDWEWVKGHAGHPENERADALARIGLANATS